MDVGIVDGCGVKTPEWTVQGERGGRYTASDGHLLGVLCFCSALNDARPTRRSLTISGAHARTPRDKQRSSFEMFL